MAAKGKIMAAKGKMVRAVAAASVMVLGVCGLSDTARAAGAAVEIPHYDWSFSGPFGVFDRGQLQRGFQVYREVCASCHGLRLVSIRNIGEPGGPGFTEAQVKAVAAEYEVTDGPDESGDMFTRPGKPSDRFPSPFENDNAAKASNNGALPPDLSVISKARPGGADFTRALLIGYTEVPADFELQEGLTYNKYFPGHQIAMPSPLSDGLVEYTDGSPMTVDQYGTDVAAFLAWTAEPHLEARHRMGFMVVAFLVILAGLLYATKRRLFAEIGH